MKKIININLSGRVIPIEDSAYEKLQSYIESLRRYFAHEEGRDEIINDIESRIAELMNEKVSKGASSITESDVDEIAASMGRPEDFDADTTETTAGKSGTAGQQGYSYSENRARKRLYRDSSDKFIGGVCSGIANYLNTDPAIVRILFAIITFGGFGLGFLLYILLWMVLPDRALDHFSGKRLYRNPDDRVIGGVAGGLAAYFNSRTSTIRLVFAAPIVLSILISMLDGFRWNDGFDFFPNIVFGSLSGTFILAYIVLWIVLPEAQSPYEKMEMRGEKVDVNSIRQNVQEGMGNVKDKVKGWSEEVKESAQSFSNRAKEFANTRGRTFANEVRDTTRTGSRGIGHAIGLLFKIFFLFIAGTIAFGIFVALIALIFGGVAWWPINNFLWTSKWQQFYAWGTLVFFFAVPLIAFIIWVIRRVLRVRSRNSYLGWTFGSLWALGWVVAVLFAASLSKDFREYEHTTAPVNIVQPVDGKMIVTVTDPELDYTGRFGWMNDDDQEGWDLSEDTMKLSAVRFRIHASKDSTFYVSIKKYSYGKSEDDALQRAEKVQYRVYSSDSVLDIANGYAIDQNSKFRFQDVEIEILVPVGKKIRFDQSVNEKLSSKSFRIRRSYSRNGRMQMRVDEDVYMDRFAAGIDYTMGIDGNLKDSNGKDMINREEDNRGEDYRYDDNDSIRLRRTIEKELEEKKNKKQTYNRITNDEAHAVASSPTSVYSLTSSFF